MPASPLWKPALSRRSVAIQALFVILLLLVAGFLWTRDQPERVAAGPTFDSRISGDTIYDFATQGPADRTPAEPAGSLLQTRSIHDGNARVIDTEDAHYRFSNPVGYTAEHLFSAANGKLYYAVERRPDPVRPPAVPVPSAPARVSTGAAVRPPSDSEQFLGTFRLQSNSAPASEAAGLKRRAFALINSSAKEVRFRQVPLQGGKPEEGMTIQGDVQGLIGDRVFWIRPRPEEKVAVTRETDLRHRTYWNEETARSDLMLTSLANHTTRCLRHGIFRHTNTTVSESGISWEECAPFPGRPTRFYASAADGSVRSLQTGADNSPGIGGVVEAGNRLYWIAGIPASGPHGSAHAVLMSADKGGTDVRAVVAQRDKHLIDDMLLHAYRDSLYCCLTEAPTITRSDAIRYQYLCRLRPERSDPLEVVYKLPGKSMYCQFGEGYLYFIRTEQKRGLWATLTNDEVGMETQTMTCRVPLAP